ncbi:hypothetical protein LTR37_005557 [Vermiconidia calcicola]|uniref:Uncharacterized protein n=1 Tax=Vermiconidia calcicola TaxID=1690605 RepID=A0ACC3NK58_9PEZI|nr:hypothetical protein LTR37_005557 [Vermiconidia calcicola]
MSAMGEEQMSACENKRANPLTSMQAQAKTKAEDMTKLNDTFKELKIEVQEGKAKIALSKGTKDAANIKAQAEEIAKLTDEYTKKMKAGKNKHALVKISALKANKHALGVKIKAIKGYL